MFFNFFFFFFVKSRRHTKRRTGAATCARPSFGMTAIQAIRDHYAWRAPYIHSKLYGTISSSNIDLLLQGLAGPGTTNVWDTLHPFFSMYKMCEGIPYLFPWKCTWKCTQLYTAHTNIVMYTLLQKNCTLISPSSPGDPGSLTLTPGHVESGSAT